MCFVRPEYCCANKKFVFVYCSIAGAATGVVSTLGGALVGKKQLIQDSVLLDLPRKSEIFSGGAGGLLGGGIDGGITGATAGAHRGQQLSQDVALNRPGTGSSLPFF